MRLLNRSTRKVVPTETGRGFHRHCQALVSEAESAWESVEQTRSEPRGLVRMSCPIQMLRSPVNDILVRFMAQYPDGARACGSHQSPRGRDRGRLRSRVARAHAAAGGFGSGGAAAGHQFHLHGRGAGAAGDSSRSCCALADLAGLPTLAQTRAGDNHSWEFIGPEGARATHRHLPRLIIDDFPLLRQAAIEGLGIACLPEMLVQQDLEAGRLQAVLPDYTIAQGIAHAAFPSRRGMVPAVRALLDALVSGFARCTEAGFAVV